MTGTAHFERTAGVESLGNDLGLLGVIEELVLDAAASGDWRSLDRLERSVVVRGTDGSVRAVSFDEANREVARSGINIREVELLIREPLSVAPLVRAVRVDAYPNRAGVAHVWGPELAEVLGLAQQIENLAGQKPPIAEAGAARNEHRPGQPSKQGDGRVIVRWWRHQGVSGQVIATVIGGLILLAVTALLAR